MVLKIRRSDLPKGPPGAPGPAGTPGRDGKDGKPGRDGRDGVDGREGLSGKDGRHGKDGRDGVVGTPGNHGQGLNWRGQWNAGETYLPYDLVRFSGSAFICTVANRGQRPSVRHVQGFAGKNDDQFWDLLAVQGDSGPAGNPGADGTTTDFSISCAAGVPIFTPTTAFALYFDTANGFQGYVWCGSSWHAFGGGTTPTTDAVPIGLLMALTREI